MISHMRLGMGEMIIMVTKPLVMLFVVGQCLRLIGTDPWIQPVHRIIEVGHASYQTALRRKDSWLWSDAGFDWVKFDRIDEYEITECK